MTAQEKLAPLAAKLHAALADEKQRVNLLVCTGLAGLVLLGVTAWRPAGNSTQSPQTVQTDTAADYATQLDLESALISANADAADGREGIDAFLNKRAPQFG